MKPNELEKLVLKSMLDDPELKPVVSAVNFDALTVMERDFTGTGFFTEFERSNGLKLFQDGVSMRWGKVGARLNANKLETGYLVYVDDGYMTTIEGYTYGDEWPDQITTIEMYELKSGMDLMTPPTQ